MWYLLHTVDTKSVLIKLNYIIFYRLMQSIFLLSIIVLMTMFSFLISTV